MNADDDGISTDELIMLAFVTVARLSEVTIDSLDRAHVDIPGDAPEEIAESFARIAITFLRVTRGYTPDAFTMTRDVLSSAHRIVYSETPS